MKKLLIVLALLTISFVSFADIIKFTNDVLPKKPIIIDAFCGTLEKIQNPVEDLNGSYALNYGETKSFKIDRKILNDGKHFWYIRACYYTQPNKNKACTFMIKDRFSKNQHEFICARGCPMVDTGFIAKFGNNENNHTLSIRYIGFLYRGSRSKATTDYCI